MGSTKFESISYEAIELDYYAVRSSNEEVKEDFNSLFGVVKNVLQHSITVAEKCFLGKNVTSKLEVNTAPTINCSFSLLRKIYCRVACEENSKDGASSASIIANEILSNYSSWVEKAVLTLAAFALSYGELLYYTDRDELKPFPLLISSLRRVDELINVKGQGQFQVAISHLNVLIKQTLEVLGFIIKLDTLSKTEYKDDPLLVDVIVKTIESYSAFAIDVLIACMTQVHYLTYDRIATTQAISFYSSEVIVELTKLKETVEKYILIIEERKAYETLQICFSRRKGIVEAFKYLLYPRSPVLEFNKRQVGVSELEGNNVLLFISKPDISEDEFLSLERLYYGLEENQHKYKIVWIPVVEKWGENETMGFAKWKKRMPWYVVCYEKQIVGIKYIKNVWKFSYKSMVVVLNSQGVIECDDAMPMITAWGIDAIPFKPRNVDPCIRPLLVTINDNLQIEEGKYIFVYGGKEEKWITDFSTVIDKVTSHVSSTVSIGSFSIGLPNSKMKTSHFWSRVDSLLYARTQWNLVDDDAGKHIQNLLSFRDEKVGWGMLCLGSSIIVCGSGADIFDAVSNYELWINAVVDKSEGFGVSLKNYYDYLISNQTETQRPCRHVSIKSGANGWLPEHIECQDCGAKMERVVTYKCCHDKTHS